MRERRPDLAPGYAALKGRRPTGRKLGILTMSGSAGVLMADAAADAGLDVAPLTEATRATMRAILPYAGVQNPVDVTGQIANDRTLYKRFGTLMLEEGGYDALVGFHAVGGLDEENGGNIAETWEHLRERYPDMPVFLSMLSTPALRTRLEQLHIPVFDEPGRMVYSVAAMTRFAPADLDTVQAASAPVLTGEALSEATASRVLDTAGIPMVQHRLVSNTADAVAAAEAIGFPVVLKIVSPQIAHKTDIGGVKLNLQSAEAVRQTYNTIIANAAQHAPSAPIEGVMVAPMLRNGLEMIVGVQRDPVFGPVVMLGLGGVFVEVLRDVAFRHAPFGPAQARAMIAELRCASMLDGVRGQEPTDREGLVAVLVALGRFATDNAEMLQSVEINPLLVRCEGVVGLDALIN